MNRAPMSLYSHSVCSPVVSVDGMWHEEFAQQPPVVQDSPGLGSGPDSSSNMTGHGPLSAPGLLPAVQRALFVRLTQRYPEGEEPASTHPHRAPSKEEGVSVFRIRLNLNWLIFENEFLRTIYDISSSIAPILGLTVVL